MPESAFSVAVFLRDTILCWGIPGVARTDQGKSFKSNRVRGFFKHVGTKHHLCHPGQPVEKPFIERAFRTLTEGLFRRLPGYTGNTLANRPKEIKVEYSREELQKLIDDWVTFKYAETVHSSTGEKPRARFAKLGFIARTINKEDLDILILPEEERIVRRGCVMYEGGRYFHRKLPPEGSRVVLRIDDNDASSVLVYFKGKRVCRAEDMTRRDLTPKEIKIAKRQRAKELRATIETNKALLSKYDISGAGIVNQIEAAKKKKPLVFPQRFEVVEVPNLHEPIKTVEEQGSGLFLEQDEKYAWLLRRKRNGEVLSLDDHRFMKTFEEDDHYSLIAQNLQRQLDEEAANA